MNRVHPAQSTAEKPEHWPDNVYPVSLDGLKFLGVGDDGIIYWDGKPIEVKKSFGLSAWQKFGAIVVTFSAFVAGASAAISAYADYAMLP